MRVGLLCWMVWCLSLLQCWGASLRPVYESVQEWKAWKSTHSKTYESSWEELEKHIVWHSNRAYVKQHNINAELGVYSYKVKLNHLGDLVSHSTLMNSIY